MGWGKNRGGGSRSISVFLRGEVKIFVRQFLKKLAYFEEKKKCGYQNTQKHIVTQIKYAFKIAEVFFDQ